MTISLQAGEFLRTREEYLSNFPDAYSKQEYRKASELLWGAVTQTIKFVATIAGKEIRNHGGFFDFVKELSSSLGKPEIYKNFLLLDKLHKNFYDPEIPPSDMGIYVETAFDFIKILEEIANTINKPKE